MLLIGFGIGILRALESVDSGNEELIGTVDPLEADLSSMIARYNRGEVEVVDISAVTTFSWQRLYIFAPNTRLYDIDDAVGRSWRKKCYTKISHSEGYTLFVFTDDKTVVHCLDYPREEGDFSWVEPANREGISPQEAIFIVKDDSFLIWVGGK